MDIYEAPIGHPFTHTELEAQTLAVFGGVAWPAKRAGYACILAVVGDKKQHLYTLILLDEAQSPNLREMVRHCYSLDERYRPLSWSGDDQNRAAEEIICDICYARPPVAEGVRPSFSGPYRSSLLEIEYPYAYIMPLIDGMARPESKSLYFRGSIWPTLDQPAPSEWGLHRIGEYPAIEALGFALRDALDWIAAAKAPPHRTNPAFEALRNHPMAF